MFNSFQVLITFFEVQNIELIFLENLIIVGSLTS